MLKKVVLLFLVLIFVAAALSADYYYKLKRAPEPKANQSTLVTKNLKFTILATAAQNFTKRMAYNEDVCFLIDMSIESGKNRFFIYDLKQGKVIQSSLVTHGGCNQTWLTGRRYSNVEGSGCTSLGKYRVGKPYQGRFGLAYKLYGMDSSNSNAYNRFVVLHSMDCVPEREIAPYPICQSDGCPTVSPLFLKALQQIIDRSKRPLLLWIYE